MPTPSNVVNVPKVNPKSYNKQRSIETNTLLKHQIQHFREVEKTLPRERQTGIDVDSIKTEGQAAEYIAKITKFLHGTPRTAGGS